MANDKNTKVAAPVAKRIRVRATQLGWYGNRRRRPGTEFDYLQQPGTKLPLWVEAVKGGKPQGPVVPAGEQDALELEEERENEKADDDSPL